MNRPVPRADARVNRARVILAARELFGERGASAEMRDIAEHAGVAVGTIYRNYPTKGDLILAVLTDIIEEATREADAAESLSDPLDAMQALVEYSIVMAERYGWIAEAFISGQMQGLQEEVLLLQSYKTGIAERFGRLLRSSIGQGLIRNDIDVAITAMLLTAATSPWLLKPLLESRSPNQLASDILRALLARS